MTVTTCIPDDVLHNLAAGDLTDEVAAGWEEHLLGCADCVAKVRGLISADTLVAALQAGATVEMSTHDATVIGKLIGRLADRSQWAAPATEPPAAPVSPGDASRQIEAATPDPLLGPGATFGPYRLVEKIGAGGMGAVYKAVHTKLDKVVAIKVLPAHLTQHRDSIARFEREMRAVGKLDHPHIVRAMDAGEIRGVHYLAMEYVEGADLQKLVQDRGPLNVANACKAVRQAALALVAAHGAGLVHRDIKPSNLLVAKSGQVKVLDLGLARLGDDGCQPGVELTTAGQTFGTPDYMAPEQWEDAHTADPRTDLYALGCTLFYLLTGRTPYGNDKFRTTPAKMKAHVVAPIPDLAAARKGVPDGVVEIYRKLMAKAPDDRIQTAALLAEALAPFTSSKAATASGDAKTAPLAAPAPDSQPQPGPKGSGVFFGQPGNGAENPLAEKDSRPRDAEPAIAGGNGSRRGRNRNVGLAAGGAAALVLFGAIVITITNKNGTKTTLNLPEGIEANVKAAAGSKVNIEQINDSAGTTGPNSVRPQVKLDLSPPARLGTWEMGPAPPWFEDEVSFAWAKSAVVPGILERPRVLPGIKRWNVDTVWPRGQINVASWSPDGKWIATGSADGHVRIYDDATLKLHRLLPGGGFGLGVLDLSWHPDSRRLAVASETGAVYRVMDLDGAIEWEIADHRRATCIAWNHAGTQCAVAFEFAQHVEPATAIIIRDAAGREVSRIPGNQGVQVGSLVWSPDDKTLAAWHNDGKLRLWNFADQTANELDDMGHNGYPGHRMAWSPQGWLAVATGKEVRLYGPDGKRAQQFASETVHLAWHPDGNRLLCSGYYPTVWDRDSSAEVARGSVQGYFPAWSPDGKTCVLAEGSDVNPACLTMMSADLKTTLASTPGIRSQLCSLAWSPDGRRLASGCSYFDLPRLWNESGVQVRCWNEPDAAAASWLAWRPDGQTLLGGNATHVWESGETGAPHKFFESDKLAWGWAVWSPDGQFAAISLTDAHVHIVDRAGKPIAKMATGGTSHVYLAWSHLTNRLAVSEPDRPLLFCDPKQGWTLKPAETEPLVDHHAPPVWSPDGRLLSVPGNGWFDAEGNRVADASRNHAEAWRPDGEIDIGYGGQFGAPDLFLRSRAGEPKRRRVGNGWFTSFAWHPRGNLIATGHMQSAITAWTEADMQPYWHAVLLPEGKAATFSAAGELISGNAEEVDPYLVYYVEREGGKIETLTPAEFRKLIPAPAAPQIGAAEKRTPLAFETPGFDAWVKQVASLPPEAQIAAVSKKFVELNPEFDGKETHKIEDGTVAELQFFTDVVTDISPVRALGGLRRLTCSGSRDIKGKLADLTPLQGMSLTFLVCSSSQVTKLGALRGMPLTFLDFGISDVSDLLPLQGMPLVSLNMRSTKVSDLTPLKESPLITLSIPATQVSDLSPLQGLHLESLEAYHTPVSDLSPLKDMPLKVLYCSQTSVSDLSPIMNMPLRQLVLDFRPLRDTELLRSIKTLETINDKPVAEFWKEVDAAPKPAE